MLQTGASRCGLHERQGMQELPDVLSLSSCLLERSSLKHLQQLGTCCQTMSQRGQHLLWQRKQQGSRWWNAKSQRDGLSKMGRDGAGSMIICHNCGGRGHMAYECPSARLASCGVRRYWSSKINQSKFHSSSYSLGSCLVILSSALLFYFVFFTWNESKLVLWDFRHWLCYMKFEIDGEF